RGQSAQHPASRDAYRLLETFPRTLGHGSLPPRERLPAAPDGNELFNDIADRLGRVDLVSARGAEQRLNLRNVTEDERTFVVPLAVVVGRSILDTAQEHVDRRAEKHYRVETRIEATLIRNGPTHVKRCSFLSRQKFLDQILTPDVSTVCIRPLAPRCAIGLDDLEAPLRDLGQGG